MTNPRLEVIFVKILYTGSCVSRAADNPLGWEIASQLRRGPPLVYPGKNGSMAESDAKTASRVPPHPNECSEPLPVEYAEYTI
jgi:hypothetical protein